MAALAMACTYSQTDLYDVQELLQEALWVVTNGFLDEQEKEGGMIGNIYSMGLALQVWGGLRHRSCPVPLPEPLTPPPASSAGAGGHEQFLLPAGVGLHPGFLRGLQP